MGSLPRLIHSTARLYSFNFFCIFSQKIASPGGLDLAQPGAILDTDLCNFTEADDQQEDNEEEFTEEEQTNRFMKLCD
jgi:hypothetical protein